MNDSQQETNRLEMQSSWRDTATFPKLLIFDARSLFPVSIWLCHISWATFYFAMAGTVFFIFLEYLKITPAVIFRYIRCAFAGPKRSNYDPIVYRRRLNL